MILITDTNILFSFFRKNPVRAIIVNSALLGLRVVIPEYSLEELSNNKRDICKYARLKDENEAELAIEILKLFVETRPLSFFEEYKEQGKAISPDPKDAPFFALALKLGGVIWSNEPRLKQQSAVKVYSTRDLIRDLGLEIDNGKSNQVTKSI